MPRPIAEVINPAALAELPPLLPPPDFTARCAAINVELEPGDPETLGRYLAMLLDTNARVNLTAITDPAEAWTRHILDSLALLQVITDLPTGARVMDVGSGGGLPGMVLAITCPESRFTLLEATGKKAEFLRAVVAALSLKNVTVLAERAETAGHDRGQKISSGGLTKRVGAHRESYDLVVARAVGRLAMLAELTTPFARTGGRIALVKGQQADEELAEAGPALHLLKAVHVATIDTPTGRLVILEKGAATPRDYPRRDGEPKRAPLGIPKDRAPRPRPGNDLA